jgi:hypothetical protein
VNEEWKQSVIEGLMMLTGTARRGTPRKAKLARKYSYTRTTLSFWYKGAVPKVSCSSARIDIKPVELPLQVTQVQLEYTGERK